MIIYEIIFKRKKIYKYKTLNRQSLTRKKVHAQHVRQSYQETIKTLLRVHSLSNLRFG